MVPKCYGLYKTLKTDYREERRQLQEAMAYDRQVEMRQMQEIMPPQPRRLRHVRMADRQQVTAEDPQEPEKPRT